MPNVDSAARYHSLPDRSPYLYYRTPYGNRLLFASSEIHAVDQVGPKFIVTSIFGYKYIVTSLRPEVVAGTQAEQLLHARH